MLSMCLLFRIQSLPITLLLCCLPLVSCPILHMCKYRLCVQHVSLACSALTGLGFCAIRLRGFHEAQWNWTHLLAMQAIWAD